MLLQISKIDSNVSYPVVKYLTKDNIPVTKESDIGFIPGYFKKGQSIEITYEKANPTSFIINNRLTYAVPWIMIIVAILLFLFSGYLILREF